MPFSLRSDEELVAEARRALEALGVEVVVDRASSNKQQCAERNQLWLSSNKSVIATSRAMKESTVSGGSVACAAFLLAPLASKTSVMASPILRNRQFVDGGAAAAAWWRSLQRPEQEGGDITCCACHRRAAFDQLPCPQCHADICKACVERARHMLRCPQCSTWYLEAVSSSGGVPWDMPRPAPTRTRSPAAYSALPQRMAAAVGPDGWLRRPPRHQRMHPVDVLVDGVLAALDGDMSVLPAPVGGAPADDDFLTFTRLPLSDQVSGKGSSLDTVRRRLKQVVDRLMREAHADRAAAFPEVAVQVARRVARTHPTVDKLVLEVSMFTIRKRERSTRAGPATKAHAWELVQVGPDCFTMLSDGGSRSERVVQVAYLEVACMEVPPAVRQVLRDAHTRLGGAACGAKEARFLYRVAAATVHVSLTLDQHGRATAEGGVLRRLLDTALRQARMEGQPVLAVCQDVRAVQLAGLEPGSRSHIRLENCVWRLEGLARQQCLQRRRGKEGGVLRWERHGGAGRRGRRRREPSVVFELGPWGQERRALPHEEAAWALAQPLRA